MAREYRSALALEQAVKAAAKRSGQDVGRAVEGFYVGRLLERVFSEEGKPFVLKGGRAILARTIDARYTTDTDFLYRGDDLEEALEELKRLASKDLVDLVLHVTRYGMSGSDLSRAIEREAGMRGIVGLHAFKVPDSWRGPRKGAYRKAAVEAKIPDRWLGVADAEEIVEACVDPAIRREVEGLEWNPRALEWTGW